MLIEYTSYKLAEVFFIVLSAVISTVFNEILWKPFDFPGFIEQLMFDAAKGSPTVISPFRLWLTLIKLICHIFYV